MKVVFFVLFLSLSANSAPIDNILRQIEKQAGCKMVITSGYRTKKKNKEVGGVKNSYHLYNRARDIVPKDPKCVKLKDIWKIACNLGSGILYKDHVHIDNRKKRVCFKLGIK